MQALKAKTSVLMINNYNVDGGWSKNLKLKKEFNLLG